MKDINLDKPKSLGDSWEQAFRQVLLSEPHMAPLVAFVSALRKQVGSGAKIPDFDPWDGGVQAEILFLLEAPGAKAVQAGFISRNNSDETAKNFFELNVEAGIPRERTAIWNIVPWYIGTETRIRAAVPIDIDAGMQSVSRLLRLFPHLRTVVLLGRKAERAERVILDRRPEVRILRSPHPSPLFVNNAWGNRKKILDVLSEAAISLR